MARKNALILDCETTGLSFKDELIELCIVAFEFDSDTGGLIKVNDKYWSFRDTDVAIESQAAKLHRISKSDIAGVALDQNALDRLCASAEMVFAHNAKFDYLYLTAVYPSIRKLPWYCTLRNIDWREKGFRSCALNNLLHDHNISINVTHRAESDVLALLKLVTERNTANYTYLLEAFRTGPLIKARRFR